MEKKIVFISSASSFTHSKKISDIFNIIKKIKIERLIYLSSADENGFSNNKIIETGIINPQNKYGLIKSHTTKYIENICSNREINLIFIKLKVKENKKQIPDITKLQTILGDYKFTNTDRIIT